VTTGWLRALFPYLDTSARERFPVAAAPASQGFFLFRASLDFCASSIHNSQQCAHTLILYPDWSSTNIPTK
jgi:hypothetical protein